MFRPNAEAASACSLVMFDRPEPRPVCSVSEFRLDCSLSTTIAKSMQVADHCYLCLALSWRLVDPNSRSNLSKSSFCRKFQYAVRRGTLCTDRVLGGIHGLLKGVAGPKAEYVEFGNHDWRYRYCDRSLCQMLGLLRWRGQQ